MFFNLGAGAMAKFVNMNKALNTKDWATAAKEMKNSAWLVTNK
jgi:hypothetical protein